MRQQAPAIFRLLCLFALLFGALGWALDQQTSSADSKTSQPPAAPTGNSTAVQNSAAPGSPTTIFSSRTDLVLVPVIVHDHSGAHVKGLSKDDFIVEENGDTQKIAIFEEVTTDAQTRMKRATIAPGIFTNTLQSTSALTPRLNIVVLDTINTAFADQAQARQQLIKFLEKSVERHEMTALLVLHRGGLKVVHDFTRDPTILIAALRKVRGATDMMAGENTDALITGADTQAITTEADDIQSFLEAASARVMQQLAIQDTLDAFAAIAEAFRGLPGRKALIWVTGSFPFLVSQPGDPPSARDFTQEMDHAFQLLNDANIAVYPVDARGLVTLMDASTGSRPGASVNPARGAAQATLARADAHTSTLQTMSSFAEMTGGRAYFNTNDLEKAFEHASDDSSSYYMLGYYRPSKDDKPGWRKLKVKVSKSGLNLRARAGYFVNAKGKQQAAGANEDIQLALRAPMDFTSVPLAVRWEPPQKSEAPTPDGKKPAVFQLMLGRNGIFIDTSDNNHMSLEVVAVARKANGDIADSVSQSREGNLKPDTVTRVQNTGLSFQNQLHLVPGEYSVRFVVRDVLSGRIGSVLAPLKVE